VIRSSRRRPGGCRPCAICTAAALAALARRCDDAAAACKARAIVPAARSAARPVGGCRSGAIQGPAARRV